MKKRNQKAVVSADTPEPETLHVVEAIPDAKPRRGVGSFLLRLALFLLPLLLILGFPTLIIMMTGEITPLRVVARRQMESKTLQLFGPAMTGPDGAFKLTSVLLRKPKYLAMGSSRVMALRSKFFRDSSGFYNAGGAVSGFRHFRQFLENIPEGDQPKIAVLCFEQRYFNQNAGHFMLHDYQEWLHTKQDVPQILITGIRDTYKKVLIEKKYSMEELFPVKLSNGYSLPQMISAWKSLNKIGLQAIVNNNGYRNDGSYFYGKFIANPDAADYYDHHYSDTLGRVRRGDTGFQYGDSVWQDTLDEVNVLLPYCKKRGIHVVAFMPPFAPTVLDTMRASGNYAYIPKIMPAAAPVFHQHGVELFDFTDMKSFGSGDAETIDGWHASEKAYLRAFIIMAEHDPVLRAAVDLDGLKQRLAATKTNYDVFGPDEY